MKLIDMPDDVRSHVLQSVADNLKQVIMPGLDKSEGERYEKECQTVARAVFKAYSDIIS